MAPRNKTTNETPAQTPAAPAATAVATTAMKTVQGYTVQVLAFIPVDPKDLRTQAAIPTILLNIEEGKADITALMPYMKEIEFRTQNTRKRVTADEFEALFAKPKAEEGAADNDDAKEPSSTIGGAQIVGDDDASGEAEAEDPAKPGWTPPASGDDESEEDAE